MRQARLKVPDTWSCGYYHCISRVVDRTFRFKPDDKTLFLNFMRKFEAFCKVKVISFCILDNHFHLLVQVPKRPDVLPSENELIDHVRSTLGDGCANQLVQRINILRGRYADTPARKGTMDKPTDPATEADVRKLLDKVIGRMWDISAFMKSLKQEFTQTYNQIHERKGTLWEERFKSLVVDSDISALRAVCAYIDLNPVRAHIVDDPKDYRWSTHGEIYGSGDKAKRQAMEAVLGWTMETYRKVMMEGAIRNAKEDRPGLREKVQEVIGNGGQVPWGQAMMLKIRYMTEGAILGRKEFVNDLYAAVKHLTGGKKKDPARKCPSLANTATDLFIAKNLGENFFG